MFQPDAKVAISTHLAIFVLTWIGRNQLCYYGDQNPENWVSSQLFTLQKAYDDVIQGLFSILLFSLIYQ